MSISQNSKILASDASSLINGLSISGKTITYTKVDGTTGTLTTQDTNTDTKVTNTLATTTKAYVTGTTSASTNTGTQIFDTGVYLDTTAGMLTATTFKGALSGNASTATKADQLTTSRTIRTNLASTSTASFNGTANITPGVTGVLPIANGGTGASTAAVASQNIMSSGYVDIPANDDLNNYTTPGCYKCGQNATVATLSNCPTTTAFILHVYPGHTTQVLKHFNAAGEFVRYYQTWSPEGWSTWNGMWIV